MKKYKNIILKVSTILIHIQLLLAFLFLSSIGFCFGQNTEKEVLMLDTAMIKKEINGWLKSLPDNELVNFGFNTREETNSFKIGKPLYVYTLPEDSIITQKGSTEIRFEFKEEWFLPILIHDNIRCLASVKMIGKQQEVVGIGGNYLAYYMNFEPELFSDSDELRGILLIPKISASFIVKGIEKNLFYPLGEAKYKFNSSKEKFLIKKEIFYITYSLLTQ